MSLTLGLAIYFIVWWVTLFAVLPFGVRTQAEAGDVVPGTPESAPAAFRLGRIAMITTVIATFVFGLVWLEYHNRIVTGLINRAVFGA
jgi:predicted secreted protein